MALLASGMALVFSACGETSSDPAKPPHARDAAAPIPTTPCTTCLDQACVREEERCQAEPDCAALVSCEARCTAGDGGTECSSQCPHPAGTATVTAIRARDACRAAARVTCSACGTPPPSSHPLLNDVCDGVDDFHRSDAAMCQSSPPDSPVRARCRKSIVSRCCESREACERNPACLALIDCIFCDENKQLDCMNEHASGVALYAAYRACIDVRSTADCLNDAGALSPCVACWYARCADEYADWRATPDEERKAACRFDCGANESCREACDELAPVPSTWGPFSLCIEARCADVCSQ